MRPSCDTEVVDADALRNALRATAEAVNECAPTDRADLVNGLRKKRGFKFLVPSLLPQQRPHSHHPNIPIKTHRTAASPTPDDAISGQTRANREDSDPITARNGGLSPQTMPLWALRDFGRISTLSTTLETPLSGNGVMKWPVLGWLCRNRQERVFAGVG